jgi:enoyl-CoA hydratase/carnithine racemase
VVLRGEGRDFSVGADISEMEARMANPAPLAEARRAAQLGSRVMRAVMGIDQPTMELANRSLQDGKPANDNAAKPAPPMLAQLAPQ